MKLLGLDLGAKRIGVAISDGEIVSSLDTIEYLNRKEATEKIFQICRDEQIEKIILGLPVNQSKESEDMVRSFAIGLNKLITLPIEYIDEELTSKEAERLLKDSKINPRSSKYKKEVDRISAKIILEQFINNGKTS